MSLRNWTNWFATCHSWLGVILNRVFRIEVPAKLACYWEWHGQYPGRKWCAYDFHRLSKVQTIRFVELCVQHGFADDADAPVKAKMLPLHEWQPGDRVELERLLKIAAPETFDRRRQPW